MKSQNGTRILVVDDEDYIREIMRFDLERAGFDVVEAASGTAAFEILKDSKVDLIVSDVRMPSGTGNELLQWVRAMDPKQPSFIFLSAFADIATDEALSLGAEAFLHKPIMRDDLLEVVRSALVPLAVRWAASPQEFAGARQLLIGALSLTPGLDAAPVTAIGQGGMFLAMDQGLPASYEIVKFDVPCDLVRGGRLVGFGRVRWVRHEAAGELPAGVGLEFTGLEQTIVDDVVAYLAEARPIAFVPLGPST